VYFFYDPDYAFLSLGVYSALKVCTARRCNSLSLRTLALAQAPLLTPHRAHIQEIELVQQTSLSIPRFKYSYMGTIVTFLSPGIAHPLSLSLSVLAHTSRASPAYYIYDCPKMNYKVSPHLVALWGER
jgi:hypothetical protein